MIMYSKKLGSYTNSNFVSSYNILPSILDLFGIPYQTNYYLGKSIFSDEIKNDIFISKTGGIFNQLIYSSDGVDIHATSNIEPSLEQIDEFRAKLSGLYNQQRQIDLLYQFDLLNSE